MGELAAGRFFDAYGASLDAALAEKVAAIEPWLVPGLVVDRGCGTGALMRLLAGAGRKVVGVELSDALARKEPGVIKADVVDPVFADGFVENIVMSSVMHEVFSYNEFAMAAVTVCLTNCARELRPGGRLIIRDIWSPEPDEPCWTLELDPDVWERFEDFLARAPVPMRCDRVDPARRTARLATPAAVEFLSKKDYVRHWELELAEVYTSVPLSAYRGVAKMLDLDVVHASPSTNDWIVENRWRQGVRGDLPPHTNQVVVLQKR